MKPPITYIPNFIENPEDCLKKLQEDLAWERREGTPRLEYYINKIPNPYTYGSGRGVRTYEPKPTHAIVEKILGKLKKLTGFDLEVCFLNRYLNQSDHLGWHADDSPEMDDSRPIAIISLGVAREIWFCPQDNKNQVVKVLLEPGSLCLMAPGMQDKFFHRIPKAGFICGERISLTFRGYLEKK